MTKDEKYLLALYIALGELKDPQLVEDEDDVDYGAEDPFFDRYEIGTKIGMHPKQTEAISAQLVRANFLRKRGVDEITLTDHGKRFVENNLLV